MVKDVKKIIKRLEEGTVVVKKKGSKYCVRDVVEFDGNFGCMTKKQFIKRFG